MTQTGEEKSKRFTLRKVFFTGIFFLFPIGVTFWLLSVLVKTMEGYARPLVERMYHQFVPPPSDFGGHEWVLTVISLLLSISFIMLIGALANFYLGKKLLGLVDTILLKVPFIRSIYGGTKQILDAFSLQHKTGSFKKVVLLEYPRRGSWVLGFVTNENLTRANALFGNPLVGVFVPSTPNPTTGFLLFLEPGDLYVVGLDVEEAVKLIVSAGLVLPDNVRSPATSLEAILRARGIDIPRPKLRTGTDSAPTEAAT